MNNQEGYNNFNAYQSEPVPSYDEQKSVYSQLEQPIYQYDSMQQSPYMPVYDNPMDGSKTLGIISVVLSSVGLGCCGIQFSIIGVILGIIAMVNAKKAQQKSNAALVGIILGSISILLYVFFFIAYFSIIVSTMSTMSRELF